MKARPVSWMSGRQALQGEVQSLGSGVDGAGSADLGGHGGPGPGPAQREPEPHLLRVGVDAPLVHRLRLDANKVAAMADGVEQIAGQVDPVGQIIEGYVRPNGLPYAVLYGIVAR